MKEINVNQITEAIASMAADIACIYDPAVFSAIQKASSNERDEKSKQSWICF
jgi:tartrate dehydratase alpha subunit/fumarate hydratase class I-like protein